jgi:hypothetical protein
MKASFVCNHPGPLEEVKSLIKDLEYIYYSGKDVHMVDVKDSWVRVNDNFIGEPFGNHVEGDLGIYYASKTK